MSLSREEDKALDNSSVLRNRSSRVHQKLPVEYQVGDDISSFFELRKIYLPSFATNHAGLLDELAVAKKQKMEAMLTYLSSVEDSIKSRASIILALGRLKHDNIYASKFRPSGEKTTQMDERSISITPSPTGVSSDSRKSRMEGIDISSLPAGFGKRRTSGGGGINTKKPKAPVEAAPELRPGTAPQSSPES